MRMLVTSHGFGWAYGVVLLLAACAADIPATRASLQSASVTRAVEKKRAKSFHCRNASDYRLVVVANPKRKKDSDSVIPEDLHIVVGEEVISKIELPKESEVKNFSLDSIEKNKSGFEIKVDWGSGIDHYEIQFTFTCKENNFYLYRVKKVSFSTTDSDRGNFLDRKKSKVTRVEPNLPIQKFVMLGYL